MKNILLGLILGASALFASVDINHATVNELTKLKGVGKSKAQNILSHIKKNGCFKKVDELTLVKGIGKKIVSSNIKEILITPCK